MAAKHDHQTTKAAALKVIRQDGIAGLYDGLTSSLLGIAVTNGIYYLCFEQSRASLLLLKNSKKASLTTLESVAASAFAGAATAILSNPIWVVNTRQTVRTTIAAATPNPLAPKVISEKKLSVVQTIIFILRTDGISAFFKGLGPALILVSNPILQFTLFEQLKNILLARRASRRPLGSKVVPILSDLDFFLLGAISKLFATGMTYPYLTLKARMYAGRTEGMSKIIQADGLSGLYKGIAPKLTQSVATAAILFLAKEKIYQGINKALAIV